MLAEGGCKSQWALSLFFSFSPWSISRMVASLHETQDLCSTYCTPLRMRIEVFALSWKLKSFISLRGAFDYTLCIRVETFLYGCRECHKSRALPLYSHGRCFPFYIPLWVYGCKGFPPISCSKTQLLCSLILHYTRMEKVEGISHRMVPHLGLHFCIPHDLGVADVECANL